MAVNICVWIGLWFAVTKQHGMEELNPHYMAFLVSVGPLVLAQVAGEFKSKHGAILIRIRTLVGDDLIS